MVEAKEGEAMVGKPSRTRKTPVEQNSQGDIAGLDSHGGAADRHMTEVETWAVQTWAETWAESR